MTCPEADHDQETAPTHVVVIGAGFAGLAAARRLGRRGGGRVRVTLVDARNHHTFQPLLYQVATAGLQPQDVGHSVRGALRGVPAVTFRLGAVESVDWGERRLRFADGGELGFDRLVVAAGAVTADYGVPGVAEHAFALKGLADAVTLRDHILRQFERVSANPGTVEDGALTFVVAGGGPTGVEVAGALSELIDRVLRYDHPDIDVDRARVVLVEKADALLGGFSESSQRYTADVLEARGVEVRLGAGISEAGAGRVRFDDGTELPTATLLWAAGVRANPLADALGIEQAAGGRIAVDEHLRVPGLDGVYAIGDVAAVRDGRGGLVPQLAPAAMQEGRHVADTLLTALSGAAAPPFHYRDKGIMATIGRSAAVAELPLRLRFRGLPAWLAWLLLHLLFLLGFRNRASVLLHLAWSHVTSERGARAVFTDRREHETAPSSTRHDSPGDRNGGSAAEWAA